MKAVHAPIQTSMAFDKKKKSSFDFMGSWFFSSPLHTTLEEFPRWVLKKDRRKMQIKVLWKKMQSLRSQMVYCKEWNEKVGKWRPFGKISLHFLLRKYESIWPFSHVISDRKSGPSFFSSSSYEFIPRLTMQPRSIELSSGVCGSDEESH